MEQCIRSLKALDYPADRYEIIFADGRSTDRTAEIARNHGCRVVDNPELNTSAGRNAGFAASKGDIVVFTHADCLFSKLWLRRGTRYFRIGGKIGGLSGPTEIPDEQNSFGKAVGLVFDIAGVAGGTAHVSRHGEPRLTGDLPGCNAFYHREALNGVMPSDTSLYSNGDVYINGCLRRCRVRLVMTPDVSVKHYKRTEPKEFWRQIYRLAIGRAQLGKRDPGFLRTSHWMIGVVFPVAVIAILVGGFFFPAAWWGALSLAALSAMLLVIPYSIAHTPAVGFNVLVAMGLLLTAWPLGFLHELFFPVGPPYVSQTGRRD